MQTIASHFSQLRLTDYKVELVRANRRDGDIAYGGAFGLLQEIKA